MPMYVVGHKVPDTDAITSAMSLANLQNELGRESVAIRLGELNPETAFVLERFGLEAPLLKTSVAGEDVYITDHSDKAQSPDDIEQANIVGIVDHHKLGDITTASPLEAWIRPWGCANTIIKDMYDYYGIEIPQAIAGIMLCAILSDTVIFKSPTCTAHDVVAAEELARIAGVGDMDAVKELGMEMFNAKSAVDGVPMKDLVTRDFKDFDMNGKRISVGQLEVVDLSLFDGKREGLLQAMHELQTDGRHSVLLLLTDIMKEGSELLVVSEAPELVEQAFDVTLTDSKVWIDGMMSRKKQVIPPLEGVM